MGNSNERGARTENNLPYEIERRFLITQLPAELANNLHAFNYSDIEQGYLPSGERLRKETSMDGIVTFARVLKTTIKNTRHRVKLEPEKIISEEEFEAEWGNTYGNRISKRRYIIPYKEHEIELNIFKAGLNDGKMLVEVEFTSELAADKFRGPGWFGRDVTSEITSKKLARGVPMPQDRPQLVQKLRRIFIR